MESPSLDSFRAMAGWFSRRSGSRVSIHNPVRPVLRAPSLSINPMPPRITRKSDRRKVSDRTMVGTAQPLCLSASGTEGRRCDGNMNLRKRKTHRVSLHYWGWTANTLCFAVAGEAFVLTSPFIERGYRKLSFRTPRLFPIFRHSPNLVCEIFTRREPHCKADAKVHTVREK